MKQEKNIWEQSRVELFQKLDCRETGLSPVSYTHLTLPTILLV